MITVSVDLLEIYFGSTATAQWHPGYVTGQVICASPSGASGEVVVRFCCHPCGWDEGKARFASHAGSWVREVRCVEGSDPVLPGDWIWSEWVPQRSSSDYRETLLDMLNASATLELVVHCLPPSEVSVVAVASPLPGQYSVDGQVRLDEDGRPYLGSPSWSMWAQDEDEWASCDDDPELAAEALIWRELRLKLKQVLQSSWAVTWRPLLPDGRWPDWPLVLTYGTTPPGSRATWRRCRAGESLPGQPELTRLLMAHTEAGCFSLVGRVQPLSEPGLSELSDLQLVMEESVDEQEPDALETDTVQGRIDCRRHFGGKVLLRLYEPQGLLEGAVLGWGTASSNAGVMPRGDAPQPHLGILPSIADVEAELWSFFHPAAASQEDGVPSNQRMPASHPDRFAREPLPRLYGRELARSPSREYVVDVLGETVVPLESAKGAHKMQWDRMHSLAADLLERPLEIWEQEFPCLQGVAPRRERVYLGFLPSGRHYPFVAARTVLCEGHWRLAVFDQVTTAPLWMRRWGTLVYRAP